MSLSGPRTGQPPDDANPPISVPSLHKPWSRFITGLRRRRLSHERCMFTAASTSTSKPSMPTSPAASITGDVASPMTAGETETTVLATSMTRRDPQRVITGQRRRCRQVRQRPPLREAIPPPGPRARPDRGSLAAGKRRWRRPGSRRRRHEPHGRVDPAATCGRPPRKPMPATARRSKRTGSRPPGCR